MTDHKLQADPATIAPQVPDLDEDGIDQVVVYRDRNRGRIIEARLPYGELMAQPRFFAPITVSVDTPMGPQPVPIEVEITAADIPSAFDEYDVQLRAKAPAAARAKIQALMAVAQKQRAEAAGRIQVVR
jgi:hypothetical protein